MKLLKITLFLSNLLTFTILQAQFGMVAHWSFDEISNNKFIDHVSNEIAGTLYGAQTIQGPVGNALYFDGNGDYLTVPKDDEPPPEYFSTLTKGSISVWFRVDNIPTDNGIRPIFYYGTNFACDFFDAANKGMIIEVGHSPIHHGSKRLYFTTWTDGCSFPSFCYDSWNPIAEGEWYHYVAVVGDDYNTGYINGQEMFDRKYNFGSKNTHEFFSDALVHERLWIGRGYWDTNNMFFEGGIDEIKIFDRPLTAEEVNSLYQEGNLLSTADDKIDTDLISKLYPNPGNGNFRFDITNTINDAMIFKVFNVAGVLVYQSEISSLSKTITINLSELTEGIYYYSLESDNQILKTEKLIIQ